MSSELNYRVHSPSDFVRALGYYGTKRVVIKGSYRREVIEENIMNGEDRFAV